MSTKKKKKLKQDSYKLIPVSPNMKDWLDYHEILRTALFKQTSSEYCARRVEKYLPISSTRTTLLLKFKGRAVGTLYVDELGNERAAIRAVAVSTAEQGKGHGRALLALAGEFAKRRGIKELCVNAASAKTDFYKTAGFREFEWNSAELEDVRSGRASPMPVQMHLKLS